MSIVVSDFFAGVGGCRLGFEEAGVETVFAHDIDSKCQETYNLNFKNTPLTLGDIRLLSTDHIPDFNILVAGFPCQPFSVAGSREGFDDKKGRGNVFFEIVRILKSKRPDGFLLENVKNLRTHHQGRSFEIISSALEQAGYEINHKIMNALDYSRLPQNRERIYIVGFSRQSKFMDNFSFPKPTKCTDKTTDYLEKPNQINDVYYYKDKPLWQKIKGQTFRLGKVYQWRRKYLRTNKKDVFPTLTANMGGGGHNVPIILDSRGLRKLTPRECFRIQGFPDSYRLPNIADSHLYKQSGNSVSVEVIYKLAMAMKRAMGS